MQKIRLTVQDREALLLAKKWIEETCDEFLCLRDLCRRAGLNEDKLKKGFKLLFGKPPYAYHCAVKMEEAKKLLIETDQPVSEIAWALGYQHASNFCTEFKKVTGKNPGMYRRVVRGQIG